MLRNVTLELELFPCRYIISAIWASAAFILPWFTAIHDRLLCSAICPSTHITPPFPFPHKSSFFSSFRFCLRGGRRTADTLVGCIAAVVRGCTAASTGLSFTHHWTQPSCGVVLSGVIELAHVSTAPTNPQEICRRVSTKTNAASGGTAGGTPQSIYPLQILGQHPACPPPCCSPTDMPCPLGGPAERGYPGYGGKLRSHSTRCGWWGIIRKHVSGGFTQFIAGPSPYTTANHC